MITTSCWDSNAMSVFNLIYIPKYTLLIFDEYACNFCETKSSEKIAQVYLWGEQTKTNVAEGDIMLIFFWEYRVC